MAHSVAVRSNKRRVRPAGLVARAGVALLDAAPFHAMAAFGAWRMGLWDQLADGPSDDLVLQRAQLGAAALVIGVVLLSAIQATSWRAPGRALFGTRVVDARSYRSIGVVRTVVRVIARDAQIVAALVLSHQAMVDRRPEDSMRGSLYVAGWVLACWAAPLAVAFFLPRSRAAHDWLTHTVVIEADGTARRPRTITEILAPAERRAAHLI